MDQKCRNKQGRKIPGSKRSMYGYMLTGFKGRTFKLCVLTDGTLISASAAIHFGGEIQGKEWKRKQNFLDVAFNFFVIAGF